MIADFLGFITGGALSLVLLLLGLLPTVDVSSLPIALPEPVAQALAALNWFVPIGDMISMLTWWIALLVAVNVFLFVKRLLDMAKK